MGRKMWAGLAATASVLALGAAAQAQAPAAAAATAGPKMVEVFTVMRDGTKLASNVFTPEGKGPWPVVLTRTPYLKDGRMFAPAGAKKWTDAGYAFVVQDVRGKGHSTGFYDAFTNDIEDGYDSVEGLAREPWSNGKVGITGASAMGITSNLAAVAQPPHLKAAYVIVAPNETFRTSFLGGVPEDKDLVGWLKGQGVAESTIKRLQANEVRNVFADRSGPGDAIRYVNIPIWNVGGWYDIFNTGSVENFQRLQHDGAKGARGNQRLTMGPFGHGDLSGDLAYPGQDRLAAQMMGPQSNDVRWFDYWLKGVNNGVMDEPPVEAFMMASARKGAPSPKNRMIRAADWPLANRPVRYYPAKDMGLSTAAPAAPEAKIAYRFDPKNPVQTLGGANLTFERGPMDQRPIKGRSDYLRFQTPVLDKDVAVAGPVSVELWAATDGPDTDFEAKLVDVYPDGYEALVLDAPIRARYRGGRRPDEVRMMTPNAPEKMTIDLWNTALTFEKGHRIALHLTSSNAPRFQVNPNDGSAPGEPGKPRVATNTIYMDRDHPTALVLPVVYLDDAR